jgi:hypothetical protein
MVPVLLLENEETSVKPSLRKKSDDICAVLEHFKMKFLTCHIQELFQVYSNSQTSTNECNVFMEMPGMCA